MATDLDAEMLEASGDPAAEDAVLEMLLQHIDAQNKQQSSKGIVQKGNEDVPTLGATRTHDGKRTIYSTEDGTPSDIMDYMLRAQMQKRNEDGTPAFSLRPTKPFKRGSVLCWLNKDHPRREEFNAMGLTARNCRKRTLASEADAFFHMQHRHKQELQVIQTHEQQAKDKEQREFMAAQMAAFRAIAAGQTAAAETPQAPKRTEEERKAWGAAMKAAREAKKQAV